MKHRLFTTIFALILSHGAFAQAPWLKQITQALQNELGSQIDTMAHEMDLAHYEASVDVSYIDHRLNFQPCKTPIKITTPSPLSLGRAHIKVQCKDTKPWALNVPVTLNLVTDVVVTNQPIPRGITIKPHHLDYKSRNLADLRNGYFLKTDLVIGKQSKRALSGQTILSEHLILPALMVRKGDRVLIMAEKGTMNVKMPGEALNDGREGRQIRVKNVRSQRIVRGKVVAPGLVLVNF